MIPNTPPTLNSTSFNCPLCGAFANQEWLIIEGKNKPRAQGGAQVLHSRYIGGVEVVECFHCKKYTVWVENKMIYPSSGTAALPNPDMPEDIMRDYNEARSILELSPRGAAALLRLAIQKLCKHLGESGENINDDIANLVKKGLPEKLQKALDIVRVVGNNAVHPGQIDLVDDTTTAGNLFVFINIICDILITQPKNIDDSYENTIPDNLKQAIEKRDGRS
jgi:hypothetical protein